MKDLFEDSKRALGILASTTVPRNTDREFVLKTMQAIVKHFDTDEVVAEIELQEQIEETEIETAIEKEKETIASRKMSQVSKSYKNNP